MSIENADPTDSPLRTEMLTGYFSRKMIGKVKVTGTGLPS